MKRKTEPLLEAVLDGRGPAPDAPLAVLLAGARRRRRARAVRRATAAVAVPALLALGGWHALRPAAEAPPGPPRPYTLVRSVPLPASCVVSSAAGTARDVRTRGDDVSRVSTTDAPATFELAPDDAALLSLLPGGAGLVGEAGERTLFWTGAGVPPPASSTGGP